jgi:hypothetical protein
MAMQFTPETGHQAGAPMIPPKTLCKTTITNVTMAQSKGTGGRYARIELTVTEGPYRGRKIWPMIADADDTLNSEAWRKMGHGALARMLESTGVFRPDVPSTYRPMGLMDCLNALDQALRNPQAFIAIETGVEKGTDGHADKASVRNYLSPNPASDSFKSWQALVSGGGATAATGRASFMAGGQAAPAAAPAATQPPRAAFGASAPSWLTAAAPAAATQAGPVSAPSDPLGEYIPGQDG